MLWTLYQFTLGRVLYNMAQSMLFLLYQSNLQHLHIMSFNVMEHQKNKLDPLLRYIIAAINTHSFANISFLLPLQDTTTKTTTKTELLIL